MKTLLPPTVFYVYLAAAIVAVLAVVAVCGWGGAGSVALEAGG